MQTTPLSLHDFRKFSHLLDLDTVINAEELYLLHPYLDWPSSLVRYWQSHC